MKVKHTQKEHNHHTRLNWFILNTAEIREHVLKPIMSY